MKGDMKPHIQKTTVETWMLTDREIQEAVKEYIANRSTVDSPDSIDVFTYIEHTDDEGNTCRAKVTVKRCDE